MASLYLSRLKPQERDELRQRLWESQGKRCFICEDIIDLDLHADNLDIDHVQPLANNGRDEVDNLALTHTACNRSKQAADLRVARLLARFKRLQGECGSQPSRPNFGDVLRLCRALGLDLPIRREGGRMQFSFPDLGQNGVMSVELQQDQRSGMEFFFAELPIDYLTHDEKINPRAIGIESLRRLIEEFHAGYPQLHVALAWTRIEAGKPRATLHVFDGQHKAAAQVLLGARMLPLRVFVNPDLDKLLTANTHAGTTLRQVAFDKSVQRRLGSQLYQDRIERYLADLGKPAGFRGFSERNLLDYFKGQQAELKRYIVDDVRDAVMNAPDNHLRGYIDMGGRGSERPLSYSTVEKTFYSFFIGQQPLSTALDWRAEEGENPRDLEKEQLIRLMNVVAHLVFTGQFDPTVGTNKLENRVRAKEEIPDAHLRANRMAREEILYSWLSLIRDVAVYSLKFNLEGVVVNEKAPFQTRLPEPLWERVERAVERIRNLPLWVNRALAESAFGGKRDHEYWKIVFATGTAPDGMQVLAEPLSVTKLMS